MGLSVEDAGGKAPKAKSPANEGRTRRSLAGGTIGGLVVRPVVSGRNRDEGVSPRMASAVLFLGPPKGPGHPSQPS